MHSVIEERACLPSLSLALVPLVHHVVDILDLPRFNAILLSGELLLRFELLRTLCIL